MRKSGSSFVIPAPREPWKPSMDSPVVYAILSISSGLTYAAFTPLDLVKCNMQVHPWKYKSILSGFGVVLKEQGLGGFFRGWMPTFLGRSAHGTCHVWSGFLFRNYYSDLAGPEYAAKHRTLISLVSFASAEVIASVALCPFEAVKVRVQTQPGFAGGVTDGLPKFVKSEGILGLYKGLVPLWGREIPHIMMRYVSFEIICRYNDNIAAKDRLSKNQQIGLGIAEGYIAGAFCAIVSNPADNLVSYLNTAKGGTVRDAMKKLGLLGLFTRGLPLRIIMIGAPAGAAPIAAMWMPSALQTSSGIQAKTKKTAD